MESQTESSDTGVVGLRVKGPSVALSAIVETFPRDTDGYISKGFNQIACLGAWKGHPSGSFSFTPEVFDQLVVNFNATKNRRVPVDREHLSETLQGSVATDGAPAAAWIVQLENRGADGLWGLFCWVSDLAVQQVRNKEYMYFSPAIVFNSVDRKTGEEVGPYLSSGALTNAPFLDGMMPLVASQTGASPMADSVQCKAVPYAGHPVVDGPWDADGAEHRLRKWVSSDGSGDPEKIDWHKYEQGFALVTGEGDKFSDYHLPHHDIRDGKLVTVKAGVSAAIAALHGARGGMSISSSDKAAVEAHLEKHRKEWADDEDKTAASVTASVSPESVHVPTTDQSVPTKGPKMAETDTDKDKEKPAAMSAEHEQLKAEHEKLKATHEAHMAENEKHLATYKAFKATCANHLGMGHESAEDEILSALEEKLGQLKKLQEEVEARAKHDAEQDAEMVAARMGVTDPKQKSAIVSLRAANPEAFRTLYASALTPVAPVQPAAPQPPAPPPSLAQLALMSQVAPVGGTPPTAVDPFAMVGEVNQQLEELALKLTREDPTVNGNYAHAFKKAMQMSSVIGATQ